jgi:chromosome segregation ATPase
MSIYTFCWNLFKKEPKKPDIVININENDIVNAVENIRARKREEQTTNTKFREMAQVAAKSISDELNEYHPAPSQVKKEGEHFYMQMDKCKDEIKEIKGITDDLRKYVSSTNERIYYLEAKIVGLEAEISLLQKEKAELIRKNKRLKNAKVSKENI